MQKFLTILTQECNAEEHKDRIQVYPTIALCFHKRWYIGDATQRIV